MPYSARIILDSIGPSDKRLTTIEATYPRMVHAEVLTHRTLSRNSSSSRAIPVTKLMAQIRNDPAMPVYWGRNQAGMQAAGELEGEELEKAKTAWLVGRDQALILAERLSGDLKLHKQIANRVMEPWMFITVIISATEWDNFDGLRCHPAAQPEVRHIAEMMRNVRAASIPGVLRTGEWHLPFITQEERDGDAVGLDTLQRLSVARCARVSYLQHTGEHDPLKDLQLADRLAASGHWSPFEHVAMALPDSSRSANFEGWRQWRRDWPGESGRISETYTKQ